MRILFLNWFLAIILFFPCIQSQSPFRFYEENYVSALFIDNVKGRVNPPQPNANCINKLIPGLNAMCARVTVPHYLYTKPITEIRCWGSSDYVLQGSPTKADFLNFYEGKGFAGMKPTCGLKTDKKIYCSGIPIPESYRKLPFRNIKVGGTQACGIVGDNGNRTLYCWGEPYESASINITRYNAVGNAYIETSKLPPSITLPTVQSTGFQTITTFSDNFDLGIDHACAITSDNTEGSGQSGRLMCWGNDLLTKIPCAADDPTCAAYPKFGYLAPPLDMFKGLSTGWYHTCITRDISYSQNDPSVNLPKPQGQCFGWNGWNQCDIPKGIHWLEFSAGFDVTCGIGVSLKYHKRIFGDSTASPPVEPTMKLEDAPKELWCWGRNNFMQSQPPLDVCAPIKSPAANNLEIAAGSKKFKPFFQLKEGECQCNSGGCECRGGPLYDYMDWASAGVSLVPPKKLGVLLIALLMCCSAWPPQLLVAASAFQGDKCMG